MTFRSRAQMRRVEYAVPPSAGEVRHDPLDHRAVGGPVVEDVVAVQMAQICVDTAFQCPVPVVTPGVLRAQELPRDGLDLLGRNGFGQSRSPSPLPL